MDFAVTDELPIIYSTFIKYWRKNGNRMGNALRIYIYVEGLWK